MFARMPVVLLGLASIGCGPRPTAVIEHPEAARAKREPKPAEIRKQPDTGARWIDLAVESEFGCAVERTGSVYCWGRDPAAEMALRELPVQPTPEPNAYGVRKWGPASRVEFIDDARSISSSSTLVCAIVEDGRVRCWGSFRWGTSHVFDVPGIVKAVALEIGESESCATLESGELWCWNADDFGVPRLRLGDAVAVSVGDAIACGLTKQGDVVCWGQGVEDWHRYNTQFNQPQPPNPSPTITTTPAVEPEYPDSLEVGRFRGAVDIALHGWNNLCVVRSDGKLVCSERDVFGVLRNEDLGMSEIANATGVAAISSARTHGCARTTDGHARCFGRNVYGQLGDGSSATVDRTATMAKLDGVVDLAVAEDISCALTRDDRIACWGYDRGEAIAREAVHVHTVAGLEASSIVAAGHTSCAVDATKGVKPIRCWGSDSIDSLGIAAVSTPTLVDLGGNQDLLTLTSNWESCFLLGSGSLQCGSWSINSAGQTAFVPATTLTDIDAVANGQPPACVIARVGRTAELRCGQSFALLEPEPAIKRPFALAASNMRACVAHGAGDVSCFAEYYGWSDGVPHAREFRAVSGIHDATALSSATYHDCALRKDGRVTCWVGRNETVWSEDGRTLAGVHYRMSDIRDVAVEPATQLVSGAQFHCVLSKAGAVTCWDDSPYGEETVWRPVPELGPDIVELAAGTEHMCARNKAGVVTCWGDDVWGQLGRVPSRVYLVPAMLEIE